MPLLHKVITHFPFIHEFQTQNELYHPMHQTFIDIEIQRYRVSHLERYT